MNHLDQRAALTDAILIRAGAAKIDSGCLHPGASGLVTDQGGVLKSLCESYGQAAQGVTGCSRMSILAAGLTSSDFRNALSSAMQKVTVSRMALGSSHRKICREIDVPNFKSNEFPLVDLDFLWEEVADGGEYNSDLRCVAGPGAIARLKFFGKNVLISREVIVNDNIELLARMFGAAGATAVRHEGKLVYHLLESNPTLGDGEPMFHGDFGNIEAAALSAASLGAAMGRLRNMKTPAGNVCDLAAAVLVVSAELEFAARDLVHGAGLAEIEVISSAWLPAGRWYLTADPEQAPTIALLRLSGAPWGVSVVPRKSPQTFDGICLGIRFSTGCVQLGRVGVIKGGA